MINVSGPVRLNRTDSIFFLHPIEVEAVADYTNGVWNVKATAKVSGMVSDTVFSAAKTYAIPSAQLIEMDRGDGKFASNLGLMASLPAIWALSLKVL